MLSHSSTMSQSFLLVPVRTAMYPYGKILKAHHNMPYTISVDNEQVYLLFRVVGDLTNADLYSKDADIVYSCNEHGVFRALVVLLEAHGDMTNAEAFDLANTHTERGLDCLDKLAFLDRTEYALVNQMYETVANKSGRTVRFFSNADHWLCEELPS